MSYYLRPTKLGEKTRKCERCGEEYKPNSRNQKYCENCRGKKNNAKTAMADR